MRVHSPRRPCHCRRQQTVQRGWSAPAASLWRRSTLVRTGEIIWKGTRGRSSFLDKLAVMGFLNHSWRGTSRWKTVMMVQLQGNKVALLRVVSDVSMCVCDSEVDEWPDYYCVATCWRRRRLICLKVKVCTVDLIQDWTSPINVSHRRSLDAPSSCHTCRSVLLNLSGDNEGTRLADNLCQ